MTHKTHHVRKNRIPVDLIKEFIKKEAVLSIAFLAALVSSFVIPPDRQWLGYFDMRTLALLYCLMTVVAGFRKAGLFSGMAQYLTAKSGSVRMLGAVLVALCFFSSMFITNDVALLTFVPFAVTVLTLAREKDKLIIVVVMQAVAANLGSMLLPVGNPQNLYIHSHYEMDTMDFIGMTLPVWAVSFVMIALLCLLLPNRKLRYTQESKPQISRRDSLVHAVLFAVCLLVVFRVFSWPVMMVIIIAVLMFYDREILLEADFMLLLTFVCFFIFSGNLARIDAVSSIISGILEGREFLVTLISSQVISNVPATLLLSGFTDSARAILLGADIGGLGTPVASLASLIAIRLYGQSENSSLGRFMVTFTIVNVVLLIPLVLIFGNIFG